MAVSSTLRLICLLNSMRGDSWGSARFLMGVARIRSQMDSSVSRSLFWLSDWVWVGLLRKLSDIAIQDTSNWSRFLYAYTTKEIHKKGEEAEILGLRFLGGKKIFFIKKGRGGINAAPPFFAIVNEIITSFLMFD